MHNIFKTTSERVSSSLSPFVVLNTYFVSCISTFGGAIYSEDDIEHIILYCHFYKCEAISDNSEEGRGGAFCLNAGVGNIKFCCAERCVASFGGDMMCWNANNTKIEYIQSFNSNNTYHGMWFMIHNLI